MMNNTIYLPDALQRKKWAPFTHHLLDVMHEAGLDHFWLSGTKDIWARDYMPVEVRPGKFVQFVYSPSYILKYPSLVRSISDGYAVFKELDLCESVTCVPIKLDGGNLVMNNTLAIITNRVFSENPDRSPKMLLDMLENVLEREVVIIPAFENDEIGHADGMVRFLDEDTVFLNDYREEIALHDKRISRILNQHGLKVHLFHYNPYRNSTNLSAAGIYLNYIQAGNVVLFPVFGGNLLFDDDFALAIMKPSNPLCRVFPVNCELLAREGGLLHCISWQRYAQHGHSVKDMQLQKGAGC